MQSRHPVAASSPTFVAANKQAAQDPLWRGSTHPTFIDNIKARHGTTQPRKTIDSGKAIAASTSTPQRSTGPEYPTDDMVRAAPICGKPDLPPENTSATQTQATLYPHPRRPPWSQSAATSLPRLDQCWPPFIPVRRHRHQTRRQTEERKLFETLGFDRFMEEQRSL